MKAMGAIESDGSLNPNSKPTKAKLDTTRTNRKKSASGRWTNDEDEALRLSVQKHNGRNWKKIAEALAEKSETQCL